MSQPLERRPLEITSFPANLQNHVKPEAPPPLKMMAARGMVPAPPEVTLRLLYQLGFDAVVKGEAEQAMRSMPAAVLIPALQAEQPPEVLDWVAEHRIDAEVREAVVLNRSTADSTVALLASMADARLCDTIANNQVRILRSPVILEELYKNANARMATIDKLLDLAQRNQVKLTGLPGLQGALDSGLDLGMASESEEDFAELLLEQQLKAMEEELEEEEGEEEEGLTRMERDRRERQRQEEEPTGPLYSRIQKMSIAQKIRLATVGNREAIGLLVRDSNRLVHMAAIQSPRLQFSDIRKLSSNKSVPDGVIRYIVGNREWTQHYDVKLNLVNNPKTPLADAISLVNHLRTNDLRQLMRNRNVSHQLSRQAKTLVSKRGSG